MTVKEHAEQQERVLELGIAIDDACGPREARLAEAFRSYWWLGSAV